MENTEGWHLRREVNIAHLLATLALAGSLVSWGMTMDTRVTRLEAQQDATSAALERAIAVVDARLDRIEDKLDRAIEVNR